MNNSKNVVKVLSLHCDVLALLCLIIVGISCGGGGGDSSDGEIFTKNPASDSIKNQTGSAPNESTIVDSVPSMGDVEEGEYILVKSTYDLSKLQTTGRQQAKSVEVKYYLDGEEVVSGANGEEVQIETDGATVGENTVSSKLFVGQVEAASETLGTVKITPYAASVAKKIVLTTAEMKPNSFYPGTKSTLTSKFTVDNASVVNDKKWATFIESIVIIKNSSGRKVKKIKKLIAVKTKTGATQTVKSKLIWSAADTRNLPAGLYKFEHNGKLLKKHKTTNKKKNIAKSAKKKGNIEILSDEPDRIIVLDGEFDDWQNVPLSKVDPTGDVNGSGSIDFKKVWFISDEDYLYISYETNGAINLNNQSDRYKIYIDTDRNSGTGFGIHGIGADVLLQPSSLHQYSNGNWQQVKNLDHGVANNRLEKSVLLNDIGGSNFDVRLIMLGDNDQVDDLVNDGGILWRLKKNGSEFNSSPVAIGQSVSLDAGTYKNITLQANDSNNDTLSYNIIQDPINGSLHGNQDNLVYIPNPGFSGSDSFVFVANDGELDSNQASVSIEVLSLSSELIANNDTSEINLGTSYVDINVLNNDSDSLGYSFSITSLSHGQHGAVNDLGGGLVRYTPNNSNVSTSDSFSYTITNQNNQSAQATVNVEVKDLLPPAGASSPNGGYYTEGVVISFSANENSTVYYTLDGTEPTLESPSKALNETIALNETAVLSYMFVDTGGNKSEVDAKAFYFNSESTDVDIDAPVVDLFSPKPGAILNAKEQVSLKVTSSEDGEVFVNGQSMSFDEVTGFYMLDIDVSQGKNEILISAKDAADNFTSKVFSINNTDRSLDIILQTPVTEVNQTYVTGGNAILVSGTVSDSNLASLKIIPENGSIVESETQGNYFSSVVEVFANSSNVLVVAESVAGKKSNFIFNLNVDLNLAPVVSEVIALGDGNGVNGGESVKILGNNFRSGVTATIGGQDIQNFTVIHDQLAEGNAPVSLGGSLGHTDVSIGSSTLADGYNYDLSVSSDNVNFGETNFVKGGTFETNFTFDGWSPNRVQWYVTAGSGGGSITEENIYGGTYNFSKNLSNGDSELVLKFIEDSNANNVKEKEVRYQLHKDSSLPRFGSFLGGVSVRNTMMEQATFGGRIYDDNLESVTINGVKAQINGDWWSVTGMPLSIGENFLTIIARDKSGNEKTLVSGEDYKIIRHPDYYDMAVAYSRIAYPLNGRSASASSITGIRTSMSIIDGVVRVEDTHHPFPPMYNHVGSNNPVWIKLEEHSEYQDLDLDSTLPYGTLEEIGEYKKAIEMIYDSPYKYDPFDYQSVWPEQGSYDRAQDGKSGDDWSSINQSLDKSMSSVTGNRKSEYYIAFNYNSVRDENYGYLLYSRNTSTYHFTTRDVTNLNASKYILDKNYIEHTSVGEHPNGVSTLYLTRSKIDASSGSVTDTAIIDGITEFESKLPQAIPSVYKVYHKYYGYYEYEAGTVSSNIVMGYPHQGQREFYLCLEDKINIRENVYITRKDGSFTTINAVPIFDSDIGFLENNDDFVALKYGEAYISTHDGSDRAKITVVGLDGLELEQKPMETESSANVFAINASPGIKFELQPYGRDGALPEGLTIDVKSNERAVIKSGHGAGRFKVIAYHPKKKTETMKSIVGEITSCSSCSIASMTCSVDNKVVDGNAEINMPVGGTGKHSDGQQFGDLTVKTDGPHVKNSSPSALEYNIKNSKVKVLKDNAGNIRQIKTPRLLIDVVAKTSRKYEVRYYDKKNVTTNAKGGFFIVKGDPYSVTTIENPEIGNNHNKLRVTNKVGSKTKVEEFEYLGYKKWELKKGYDADTDTFLSKTKNYATTTSETDTVYHSDGAVASVTVTNFSGNYSGK